MVGTCGPVNVGFPDPHGVCMDQGPSSCGTSGACDGAGHCERYLAGTPCAVCVGGGHEPDGTCDSTGTCVVSPMACVP
jgi:hypothetical protein